MSMFRNFRRLILPGVLAGTLGAGIAHAQWQDTVIIPGVPSGDVNKPASYIRDNLTLTKNTLWILKGFVMVSDTSTLTIEPGTTIQGHVSDKGTLIIDRNSKLVAAGTAAEPITFQGPNNDRGNWGGIVLLGKGYSNQSLGDLLPYEALSWANYGGNEDDEDSSGVLTYLRLSNPGFSILVDRELNGLTLCAVGRRTVIHHIQVHRGDDDGIEWFGGTVNTSHLVVTNATDDSYDTDHGYSGNSQYMIAIQNAEAPRIRPNPLIGQEVVGDRGLECGSSNGAPGRHTNPVWKNFTFIENGRSGGAFEAKEECGGTYEKMVLVAGGITTADTAAWAMLFTSPRTVNGLKPPPGTARHIDFKKGYITGKYRKKYDITGTASQITNATGVLDSLIRSYPLSELNSYGLHKDLSASLPAIAADSAGAIVGDDLWYQGWTLPGTVEFPLGDNRNSAPAITFTSTPSGYMEEPGSFTLNATVTDADGIGLLQILRGNDTLQTSSTGSISYQVSGAEQGTYTYTLRFRDAHVFPATSTRTLEVVVSEPNTAPTITVSRTGNPSLVAPASFSITANASDPEGIARIEILLNNNSLGFNNGSQVAVPISNLPAGTYEYKVRARDAHGHNPLTTDSVFVVTVDAAPNTAPNVSLTQDRSDEILYAPASFKLSATAGDGDGIASLKIFEGSTELASTSNTLLELPIAAKPAGTYTYRVEARDSHSNPLTSSTTLTVTVFDEPTSDENEDAPVVTLSLVETGSLIAPATFNLVATAVDANNIDTLQILLDGEVLATGTSLTLAHKVTGLGAGTHTFTARAKDKHAEDPKVGTKELEVEVEEPPANAGAPTVFFNRTGADTLIEGTNFTLNLLADDPDGIDSVRIFKGDEVLAASGTSRSLSFEVEDLEPGTYTFKAWAKDKHPADPKDKTLEITVVVKAKISISILSRPLRDLSGLESFAAQGRDLRIKSNDQGSVRLAVLDLAGRRVVQRDVNLVRGQNLIPVGALRGVHIVLVSDGRKSRTARVIFAAGQ